MKFRLRPGAPWNSDPSRMTLEVTRGNTTNLFPVTPEDIAALNSLVLQFNAAAPLPIDSYGSDLD